MIEQMVLFATFCVSHSPQSFNVASFGYTFYSLIVVCLLRMWHCAKEKDGV